MDAALHKPATTEYEIHRLLRDRWSPRSFADRELEPAVIKQLMEAARWAPSSRNLQPWRFVLAPRGETAGFARLLGCLRENNQVWAAGAALLALGVALVEADGQRNRFAVHDTGLAVASMIVQATALGLAVHQMGGYDPERARRELAIPEGYEPVAAIAIGYPGAPDLLPEELRSREVAKRERNPFSTFVYAGKFGTPYATP